MPTNIEVLTELLRRQVLERAAPATHLEDLNRILQNVNVTLRGDISPARRAYIVEAPSEAEREEKAQEIVDLFGEDNVQVDPDKPTILKIPDSGLSLKVKPPLKTTAGAGAKGAARTADAEMATMLACLYKIEQGKDLSPEEMEEVYPSAVMEGKWPQVYGVTARVLDQWLEGESGYTYHHEEGGVYTPDGNRSSDLPNIHKLTTTIAGSQYLGIGKKDTWNPSDMYLCKRGKESEYYNAIERAAKDNDLKAVNEILLEGIQSKELVGVSLKMMIKEKPAQEFNIIPDEDPASIRVSRIHVPLDGENISPIVTLKYKQTEEREERDLWLFLKDSKAKDQGIYPELKFKGTAARLGRPSVTLFHRTLEAYGIQWRGKDQLRSRIEAGGAQQIRREFLEASFEVISAFPDAVTFSQEDAQNFVDTILSESRLTGTPFRAFKNGFLALQTMQAAARANNEGELESLVNEWMNLAQKKGAKHAPFIKLGESAESPKPPVKLMSLYEAAGKNLHMTHVDELPILVGKDGIETSLEAMDKAFEKVMGMRDEGVTLNVKWDGAPAVYAGWHPESGEFLLALKSLFAKKPKIIYTPEDAEEYYGDKPDLRDKILATLQILQGTNFIPQGEIWQGDFLFAGDDLEQVNIDDVTHYVFQPNTLLYAVVAESDVGRDIANARVGIVWHTRYKGSTLETMTSTFDIDEDEIAGRPAVPGLWAVSPHYTYTGEPVGDIINTDQFDQLRSHVLILESRLDPVNEDYLQALEQSRNALAQQFNAMINHYIRDGLLDDLDPSRAADQFLSYLADKFSRRREDYEAKGRSPAQIRGVDRDHERLRNIVTEPVQTALNVLAAIQKALNQMKLQMLEGLNKMATRGGVIKTYLVRREEAVMEPASHEGFVIQTTEGIPLKFVDREQFSKANFSPEYKKGWEH